MRTLLAFLALAMPAWAASPQGCVASPVRTQCFVVPDGESQRQVYDTAASFLTARARTEYIQSPTNMPPAGPWLVIGRR